MPSIPQSTLPATLHGERHPKGNSAPPNHEFKLPEQQTPLFFSLFSTSPPEIYQIPSKAVSKVNIPGGMEMLLPCCAPRQLLIPWIPREGSLSCLCFPLIPVSVSWKRAGKICSLSRPHKCTSGWKTTPPALSLHFNSSPRKKGQQFMDGRKDLLGTQLIPNIHCPIPDL